MEANKVAVLLGYGPGIGKAVATKWTANGFRVAIVARTLEKLEEACKEIAGMTPFACDSWESSILANTLTVVMTKMGPVDHLIFNAGSGVWKKYDEVGVEQLEMAMKINVFALLTATQSVCPTMAERGGGTVIVTGATASLRGMPFTSVFASAKAAQKSLAQSIARQMWEEGVHICYAIIDAVIGNAPGKMSAESIANEYWHLSTQTPDCWTFMHHIQTKDSDMSLL